MTVLNLMAVPLAYRDKNSTYVEMLTTFIIIASLLKSVQLLMALKLKGFYDSLINFNGIRTY
jgi:hypothetical protein